MLTLDIFKGSAFSLTNLVASVNKQPFVPGQAGRLGIFEESGVTTTSVFIDEYNGTLTLVPAAPRGAPATANAHKKRTARSLTVPHFPLTDHITADEIQNVRPFGELSEEQTAKNVLDMRTMESLRKIDATVEYGRIGALQGIIYDSDGTTVIYNLFTEFGVTQQTVDLLLGTTTTEQLSKGLDIANKIEDALGQVPYSGIHAFLGRTLFQRFITHPNVKVAYQYYQKNQQDQEPLRDDLRYKGFTFAGVTWQQYRGKVGGIPFVPDTGGVAFPTGVPGLCKTVYAPADYMETVNTLGLPRYQKVAPDPVWNKYVEVETQTNALSFCTRPDTLINLTSSN